MQNHTLTKTKAMAHQGHAIEITESAELVCSTCDTVIWSQEAVNEKGRVNTKAMYARMKVEDPDKYRAINRENSRKHRERAKADPVKYAEYLAKAKEYNARAYAKRRAAK